MREKKVKLAIGVDAHEYFGLFAKYGNGLPGRGGLRRMTSSTDGHKGLFKTVFNKIDYSLDRYAGYSFTRYF